MTRYTVTLELKTPWYKKALRYLGLMKPRIEFEILLVYSYFSVGNIIDTGGKGNTLALILEVEDKMERRGKYE